jgi:MYXO-CTERM domain-containing protein
MARRTVAPTHAPTKAAPPPKAQDVQPQAKADEGGGWFGCQISAGASLVPVVGLGLVALVAVIARRRSRSQTRR